MRGSAAIRIAGVRKAFGVVVVLHQIDLHVAEGEFLVLVGPSGCGKSTLLRMIAGLEEIEQGTITIGGRVVNDMAPKDREVAMVFQNYALYPHKTVAENLGFSMRLRGVPAAQREAAVQRVAELLGLGSLMERYPKQLSGGQRQRVAMGRAMVREPAVFLFDEPLSNLDAKLRVQMRAEIRAMQQRLGTTTVYVTHDQVEAMTMADRIVVMDQGRILQVGSPLDLYDRPCSRFVAGFIGSPAMNFFPGTMEAAGLRLTDGTLLPLASPHRGRVELGIRPEHLGLDPNGLPATVEVLEPTGHETHVVARTAAGLVTLLMAERVALRPGERIGLGFDPARAHLFDAVTGAALDARIPA
jgi:multiple sugar transport system ATP-binding protein